MLSGEYTQTSTVRKETSKVSEIKANAFETSDQSSQIDVSAVLRRPSDWVWFVIRIA